LTLISDWFTSQCQFLGHRGYFLKDMGVMLNQAFLNYGKMKWFLICSRHVKTVHYIIIIIIMIITIVIITLITLIIIISFRVRDCISETKKLLCPSGWLMSYMNYHHDHPLSSFSSSSLLISSSSPIIIITIHTHVCIYTHLSYKRRYFNHITFLS